MSAICAELPLTRSFQISSVDVAVEGIPIVRLFTDRVLILLRHKRWLKFRRVETVWQHGHR